MASSSAPNPYGHSPGSGGAEPAQLPPGGGGGGASSASLYYAAASAGSAPTPPGEYAQMGVTAPGRRRQQPLMSSPNEGSALAGDKGALLQSSNSLASSYDASYLAGMSSDSELTGSSSGARHHHRAYSSQSRVYHAHPVPRPAHQQHQQHAQQTQAASGASPCSSSSASRYLPPGALPADSPVSPILMQQQQQFRRAQQQQQQQQPSSSGRQLPQRPFKQSMSIDHHHQQQLQQQQQFQRASAHSPAHQRGLLSEPLVGSSSYQQQQQQQQQAHKLYSPSSGQQLYSSASASAADQYSRQLEMELMEQKAGQMSLYGAGELADLPPSRAARSASSSSSHRQLPSIGGGGGAANALVGSASLEQHRGQQRLLQHCSQDPFAPAGQQLQHAQRARCQMTASADWLPPMGSAGVGASQPASVRSAGAASGHFKQTMSIDHYPASRQQQQPAQHYSPARRAELFNAAGDHYHSPLASYGGGGGGGGAQSGSQQQLIGGYMDSPAGTPSQQHAASAYYASGLPLGQQQAAHFLADHHSQQQQQQQQQTQINELKHFAAERRPKLQHQPSSSSSNSNLSGSHKLEAGESAVLLAQPAGPLQQQHQQQDNTKPPTSDLHWHKSSSVSSAHHFQPLAAPTGSGAHQSPQHQYGQQQQQQHHQRPPVAPHHGHGLSQKAEMLRRGYTSGAVIPSSSTALAQAHYGSGGELAGSQSALSESGDLSASQASGHSGQLAKRSVMRAASPSLALDGPAGTHHQAASVGHHHSSALGYARDSAVGIRSESTTGLPNGSATSSTLTKKSNSATQLSMSGTKKRLGFRKKQVTSFSVHRSEEVAPLEARHLVKQGSSVSEGDSSMSGDSSSRSWSNSNFKQQTSEELASMSFIDGLGKGQMISRQGLASPYLGDIQLSLCDRRGNLEVEVIRARNLQAKTNKIQPLTYVKLYLVKNRKCLGKAKTTLSNKRTLNPLFQQQLTFHEDYHGCILQSIVWGNFGKMDKKNFMGIAQISIDDLELSDTVISWYKLFLPSSLQTLPSKSLRHTLLSNSTESFTNTNNS